MDEERIDNHDFAACLATAPHRHETVVLEAVSAGPRKLVPHIFHIGGGGDGHLLDAGQVFLPWSRGPKTTCIGDETTFDT